MDQFEALEAAKLAALIGGQLNKIDTFSTERGMNTPPANKININAFKAQVHDPNNKIRPARYLTEVPQGFAAPLPEDFIQNQIPDVIPQAALPTAVPPPPPPQNNYNYFPQPEVVNLPHIVNPDQKQSKVGFNDPKPLFTRSDVDSIRNSLKNIDKSLSGLLSYFKNSNSDNE